MADFLLVGGSGQVGRAWISLAQEKSFSLQVLSRTEVDLLNPDGIQANLTFHAKTLPSAVILAAAYTQVDLAEKESEAARCINALSVREIARWCASKNIPLLHYSTDYVYSGAGEHARTETEPTSPLNRYGETKLEGENFIRESGCRHLIFRTSWVYDAEGKNFFKTMLKLGETHASLRVVCDQVGAPTYAPHLARASLSALREALHEALGETRVWGTYHLCAPGETNWFEFARAIFERANARIGTKIPNVIPIPTNDYPTPAKRPLNSRLDLTRARLLLGVDFDRDLPHWSLGLNECIETYLENTRR